MNLGGRIKRARLAAELSMRELADKIGVSHTAISKYEHGEDTPRPSVLLRLAKELEVPTDYFFAETRVELEAPAYRKHGRFSAKKREAIEAEIKDSLEKYLMVEELFSKERQANFKKVELSPIINIEDTEEAADQLRKEWELGFDPIVNVTSMLEEHGIRVIMLLVSEGFDGFSCFANKTIPVIVSQANIPGDRQRFNLIHELAHLMLDIADDLDVEKGAHRFAGAFLVPRRAAFNELGTKRSNLGVDELLILKQKYGLSIQAWVRRAFDLGIITDYTYRKIFEQFSKRGWRKEEPGDQLPEEIPQRFNLLVDQAMAEDLISPIEGFELLGNQIRKDSIATSTELSKAANKLAEEYEADDALTAFTKANTEDIYSYDAEHPKR